MKKVFLMFMSIAVVTLSHPGRLDSAGGHHDRKHGGYHYHRGKYAGMTQEEVDGLNESSSSTKRSAKKNTNSYLKRVKALGYDSVKEFQRENGIKADGVIGQQTIELIKEIERNGEWQWI